MPSSHFAAIVITIAGTLGFVMLFYAPLQGLFLFGGAAFVAYYVSRKGKR
jgi:uncharacterized membrane protein YesL